MSKGDLIKKIGTYITVGFLFLAFAPECKKTYDNHCLKKERHNKALLKSMDLADINNDGVVNKPEWNAVKILAGLDPLSSNELKLRDLETYLSKMDYSWNGKDYVKKQEELMR